MNATYRIDYADADDKVVVIHGQTREQAMSRARAASKANGTAYAIRTVDGNDTGQRVYHDGFFSRTDDEF